MARITLSNAERDLLAELYRQMHMTVDELPYTEEFETLYAAFLERTQRRMSRQEVWRALAGARKASRLVRKRRG
jgi:hypothetical protein